MAVRKFTRHKIVVERIDAPHQIFGFTCRIPGSSGIGGFFDQRFTDFGVFLEELGEFLAHHGIHCTLGFWVEEFDFSI